MCKVITTNKNNVMTAPTYTKIKTNPKNSASNNNHKPAAAKKDSTKNKAPRTGFRETTTMTAENNKPAAKNKKMMGCIKLCIMSLSVKLNTEYIFPVIARPRSGRGNPAFEKLFQ